MRIRQLSERYESLPVQLRASFWFLICSFMQRGISVLTTPIFTRLLSTSDYGQYNVFNSWYEIVTIFVSLSLYGGVHTQGLVKFEKKRDLFTSSLMGLVTVSALMWTIVYALFRNFWNDLFHLSTVQVLAMLIMIWLTTIFNFWANVQRVQYRYRVLVLVTLTVSLAKPLVGIFLVTHSDDKVTARILGLMLVELVGYSWFFFIQLKRGKKFFSGFFWKYAVMFNLPLIPHYLSQTVLNSADRIMIKNMCGDSKAGIYGLAYSISSIMTLFNTSLLQTISPWVFQKIKDKKNKEIAPIAYITLIIIAFVNLVLILLAPEVVAIFAPSDYYEAIWVIPPVAMSVFFMYSYDMFSKFAFYFEKTSFVMIASVIGAILNIGLNFIFIGWFGYIAAGYTTLFCFIVYAVGHYLFMRKVCKTCCNGDYPYQTGIIVFISAVFLTIGSCLLILYKYPFVRYGIVLLLVIVTIVMRKKIVAVIKSIISLKRKS